MKNLGAVALIIFEGILLTAEPVVMFVRNVLNFSAPDDGGWAISFLTSIFPLVLVTVLLLLCLFGLLMCSVGQLRRFFLFAGISALAGIVLSGGATLFFHPIVQQFAVAQQFLGGRVITFRGISLVFLIFEAAAAMILFSVYACIRVLRRGERT